MRKMMVPAERFFFVLGFFGACLLVFLFRLALEGVFVVIILLLFGKVSI